MEVKRKSIHMDRMKSSASTQITIDADVNVPDSKPDVIKILLEKGRMKIEETKVMENQVLVRGALCFSFLYECEQGEQKLCSMEGKVPFEEVVHVEGADSQDTVKLKKQLENFHVSMINSRKVNIRAISVLEPEIEELYEEEVLYDAADIPMLQKKKKQLLTTETVIDKKDMLRIREEIKLPADLPNMFEFIWDTADIGTFDFKAGDGRIFVQGEVQVFFLYEAEGDEGEIIYHETKLPVNMQLDCTGCSEDMIPVISYEIADKQLTVKPDEDGEDRLVELDMNLELAMKLYQEEKTDILEDVYGVTKEVSGVWQKGHYRKLLGEEKTKCSADGKIKLKTSKSQMLKICNITGELAIDDLIMLENGTQVEGAVELQILYMDEKETDHYFAARGSIPFSCRVDMKDIEPEADCNITASIAQISYTLPSNEEIEVHAQIAFHMSAFQNVEEEFLKDIKVSELDSDKMKELPSMIGYIAREGDTLIIIKTMERELK